MSLNYFNFPTEDGEVQPSTIVPEVAETPPWEEKLEKKPAEEIEVVKPKNKGGRPRKPRKEKEQAPVNRKEETAQVDPHVPRAEPGMDHALAVGKAWNLAGTAFRVVAYNDGLVVLERIR